MSSNGEIPLDDNKKPALAGYDATGHQIVAAEIVSVTTDSTTGVQHGALNVNATFSASSIAINDPTITTQKMTVDASGNASVKLGLALPAGSANIGGVELVDSAGTNKATIDGSGNIHTLESNSSSISTNTSNAASGIGAVADSAYTSGSGSAIALLKGIFGRIGAALGFDNTNVLKVSLYGKNSVAGDTSLLADSTGRVLIGRNCVAVYTLASVTTSGTTQNSGDLTVGSYTEISIDINTTAQAGTNPTLQYFYERKAADGIYYVLWQSAVLTAATNTLSTSIGNGMAYNQSLGATGRIRWVIGGTATPTFTHTINIQGK